MKRKSLHYHFALGLLFSALSLPPSVAHAQWTVYDPAEFILQVTKKVEEANRWIQHYTNLVQQLTTLKGVLDKAEDLVSKQKNAITTMSNIGRTVRGAYQLKNQVEAIVTTRLNAIKRIDDRLRNGIFDPEQDLRDLDEYLENSIGRTSQDMVANRERLVRMDNKLARLQLELEQVKDMLAKVEGDQKEARQLLEKQEKAPPTEQSAQAMASLMAKISNCDLLIAHYSKEIARLQEEIKDRMLLYNIQMEERVKFGEQVMSMNDAWTEFN